MPANQRSRTLGRSDPDSWKLLFIFPSPLAGNYLPSMPLSLLLLTPAHFLLVLLDGLAWQGCT